MNVNYGWTAQDELSNALSLFLQSFACIMLFI
jgi:hypothetical protein